MGTRSIIAEPYGDGWRGRYCHWDGYPEHNGRELLALVQVHGVEKVRQVLIHDHVSWSSIDSTSETFGTPHTDMDDDEPFWCEVDGVMIEWLYVLGDTSLFVHAAFGGLKPPVEVRYNQPLVDWEAVRKECEGAS